MKKYCRKCGMYMMVKERDHWHCRWCGNKEKIKIDEKFSKDGK